MCVLTTAEQTERDPRTRTSSEPVYEPTQDGCEKFAQSCLVCPLPKCYYGDMTIAEQAAVRMAEKVTVTDIKSAGWNGLPRNEIAVKYQVSESTIGRILRRDKSSEMLPNGG